MWHRFKKNLSPLNHKHLLIFALLRLDRGSWSDSFCIQEYGPLSRLLVPVPGVLWWLLIGQILTGKALSHRDHRMSSWKCLRTPRCENFQDLELDLSVALFVLKYIFRFSPLSLALYIPNQLCKKMRWSWFYWPWRTARLYPGRCWFCSSSKSSRLGSPRPPKPA